MLLDQQDSAVAASRQFANHRADVLDDRRLDALGRLVEYQQARPGDQPALLTLATVGATAPPSGSRPGGPPAASNASTVALLRSSAFSWRLAPPGRDADRGQCKKCGLAPAEPIPGLHILNADIGLIEGESRWSELPKGGISRHNIGDPDSDHPACHVNKRVSRSWCSSVSPSH